MAGLGAGSEVEGAPFLGAVRQVVEVGGASRVCTVVCCIYDLMGSMGDGYVCLPYYIVYTCFFSPRIFVVLLVEER